MRAPALLLLAALLSGACATTGARIADTGLTSTVRVENQGWYDVRVYFTRQGHSPRYIGTVRSYGSACLRIPADGVVGRLLAQNMLGGRRITASEYFDASHRPGWVWRVDEAVAAANHFNHAKPCGGKGGAPLAITDTFPPGVLTIRIHEEWGAFTVCGTRPKTWFGHEITPAMRAMVDAHEAAHRTWMGQFPSCDDYYTWVEASRENQIELEARAFCIGAKADAATGRFLSVDEAITQHAAWLSHGYLQLGLNEAEAEAEIRKYCGPRGAP